MRLWSNKGRKEFKTPGFSSVSNLTAVIMMGLQLLHGAVAISLLLPERGCVRQVQHRSFVFYSSKHLRTDLQTKQEPVADRTHIL